MTLFGTIFGKKPPPLDPAIKKMVLACIARDWKTFSNERGQIKSMYRKGTYDTYFINLAMRIKAAENVESFDALSEQGTLRLIASYNAFYNDLYLHPGLPRRRDDILPKVLDAMGTDPFREVILAQQALWDKHLVDREADRPIYAEYQKSKVPFHQQPVLEQVQAMNKDDWHNLVRTLNFDTGEKTMAWLIAQKDLDRGTAIRFVMESELLGDLSNPPVQKRPKGNGYDALVYDTVQNIISGHYSDHAFAAFDDPDDFDVFESIRAEAAQKGGPRFDIPRAVFAHQGTRVPRPRYAFDGNNKIVYDYEYWKSDVRGKP
jgi:hypothetical protein